MFTLGIGLTIQNFKNIINQPKALILGLVNQMILLPLITFIIMLIIKLPSEMAVGMMILACCPGGVTSNILTKLAKGDTALSISYTAIVSIITVFTLPLIVGFSITLLIVKLLFVRPDTTANFSLFLDFTLMTVKHY